MQFFHQFPRVIALTSSRWDREMGSSTDPGPEGEFLKNRELFLVGHGIAPSQMVMAGLVHGADVAVVSAIPHKGRVQGTDGLVTATPGIALAITTADCFPTFFYEPERRIIGIAHAGRESIFADIVAASVGRMEELGAERGAIRVTIGPGIQRCCYTVQDDEHGVRRFRQFGYEHYLSWDGDGSVHADLLGILIGEKLTPLSLAFDPEEEPPPCTFHNPTKFYSYRRDRKHGHNMLSVIQLRQ